MPLDDSYKLNLPSEPGFIFKTPDYTASQVAKLSEEMLSFFNKARYANPAPPFADVPFVLHEPKGDYGAKQ